MTLPGTNGVSPEVEMRREAKGGYADNNTRRLKQQKTKALSVSGEHEIGVADQY